MRRLKLLSLLFLGAAIVGFSNNNVLSFVGPSIEQEHRNWTFTLPVEGEHISGPVGVVGSGPVNSVATFSQFTQTNTNSNGVYDYELTLVGSSTITTTNSAIWGATGAATVGSSFMTIYPVGNGVSIDNGPPGSIPDPLEPVEVSNIVFVAGGDCVSYLGIPVPSQP